MIKIFFKMFDIRKCKFRNYHKAGKIALFGKVLALAMARGTLAMCAMWVGNSFKKCAVDKK